MKTFPLLSFFSCVVGRAGTVLIFWPSQYLLHSLRAICRDLNMELLRDHKKEQLRQIANAA